MIQKKWFRIVMIALGTLLIWSNPLWADSNWTQTVRALDVKNLTSYIETLDTDTTRLLPELNLENWKITGPDWNLPVIGRTLLTFFLKEVVFNIRILGELFLLVLALAILQKLQPGFEAATTSRIAFGVCFLMVIGIVMNSFRVTFAIAQGALRDMTGFMYEITPVLFSLIAAAGGEGTTLVLHPVLMTAVGMVTGMVRFIVIPLLLLAGALGITNYVTDTFPLGKLAGLFKKAALGLMGAGMAAFIGIITIRGLTATVMDSTALRTVKYFSNTFLPVVGGVLSDTMELTLSCSQILKSGLGVFGLGTVVVITLFPLLKILAVASIYALTSAILQPLGENRLADALETVSDTFFNLFGALVVTGLMFFIVIAMLVGIGGGGVM